MNGTPAWAWLTLALLAGAQDAAAQQAPVQAPAQPPRCSTKVQLMGVVHNDRRPARSFAMVIRPGQQSRMVKRGSRVDGRKVLAIGARAILLGPDATPCVLVLQHEGNQKVRAAPKKKKKKRKKRR